jgi:hypothetical protein
MATPKLSLMLDIASDASCFLDTRDRVAGCLVVLFAQRISRLVLIAKDDVQERDRQVFLRLGNEPLLLPEPLGTLARQLRDTPPGPETTNTSSPWLFPGRLRGTSLSEGYMRKRLGRLGIKALPAPYSLNKHPVSASKWSKCWVFSRPGFVVSAKRAMRALSDRAKTTGAFRPHQDSSASAEQLAVGGVDDAAQPSSPARQTTRESARQLAVRLLATAPHVARSAPNTVRSSPCSQRGATNGTHSPQNEYALSASRSQPVAKRRMPAGLWRAWLLASAEIWAPTLTPAAVVEIAGRPLTVPVERWLGLTLNAQHTPAPQLAHALALACHNIPIASWPLLLGALGAHQHRASRYLADGMLAMSTMANTLPVGAAIGAYGTALLPYLPQLPLEWGALALGTSGWLMQRRQPLAVSETVRMFGLIAALLICAAVAETFAVPHT